MRMLIIAAALATSAYADCPEGQVEECQTVPKTSKMCTILPVGDYGLREICRVKTTWEEECLCMPIMEKEL